MAVILPALFVDHMVLQREKPVPVWGWAEPGEVVSVGIAGFSAQAVAGADGRWQAVLPPLPVGGPYEMTVNDVTLLDVLVGEVWLCSGQSNMEMPLEGVNDAVVEIAAADYPQIRHFDVLDTVTFEPQADVSGAWTLCTPATAGSFTAAGYFFARKLWQELGVPVGLINASWGGSAAEAWTSRAALRAEPELRGIVDFYEDTLGCFEGPAVDYAAVMQRYNDLIPTDTCNAGLAQGWADPATDASAWPEMALPQSWQQAGLRFSGVLWFRKEVEIPAAWAGHDLMLHLGACDKSDISYFNGVEVGTMSYLEVEDSWCTPREYRVPGELVQAGKNVIAIRIFSHQYAGGMLGPVEEMFLVPAGLPEAQPIPLDGCWQYNIERKFGQLPPAPGVPVGVSYPNIPATLYNGMIAPLIPYAIRGALWYQGESNADRAMQYRTLFPTMIRDWRQRWGQGEFPFYFVQLANFMATREQPSDSEWAELREAQSMTLREPNTGMAVIIDAGDMLDIHPKNKQAVGLRLAWHALAREYGKEIEYSGPLYRDMQVDGEAIRLSFDHIGGGLEADGPLTGFAIAGADRRFVWADARIEGDTVLVSSPLVPVPVAVRYAWADNPVCNFYNQAGLPASPFRTDDWSAQVETEVSAAERSSK